ncbi:MAG: hypothetical protein ACLFR1_04920 [Spirochaetia bacterium]
MINKQKIDCKYFREYYQSIVHHHLPLLYSLSLFDDEEVQPEFGYMNKQAVRNEFGADLGITSFVEGDSHFLRNYDYGSVNAFYKEGSGLVCLFLLMNSVEVFSQQMSESIEEYYCFFFE